MKKLLVLAIAVASITANAQTQSAPAAETTAQEAAATAPAPTATKKAKKAKKKKSKKSAMQTEKSVDALAEATSTDIPKPATATNVEAVSPAAAGTSAASVGAAKAPDKKWALKAQLYSTTDFTNTQNIQNLSTFGGSYKVLPNLTLKASQTFETLTNGRGTAEATRRLTNENNFRPSYSDVGFGTALPGFFGSEETSLSVTYKNMGGTSDYTQTDAPEENYKGGYQTAHYFIETNFGIPFTISPKWSVSIDSQWRHIDSKEGLNRDRFLSVPSLSYAINDLVSVYQAAGYIISTKDAGALRRNYERIYAETGVTLTPVKGLNMTFMVDQDKAVYASPTSGVEVSNYSFYKPNPAAGGKDNTLDAVAYEALITYAY